jgi:hypothetical protein
VSGVLPANRVAALVGVLTGLAAFVTGLAGVLPHSWQSTALAIVGVLTVAAHNLHYLTGAQRSEALDAADREPGDQDALPHLVTNDPANVPPDQGQTVGAVNA